MSGYLRCPSNKYAQQHTRVTCLYAGIHLQALTSLPLWEVDSEISQAARGPTQWQQGPLSTAVHGPRRRLDVPRHCLDVPRGASSADGGERAR